MSSELKFAAGKIKKLELGTWLEFSDKDSGALLRGKLAWVDEHTFDYMFVNQSGRRIAVKSLYDLAGGLIQGEARILPIEKMPFITRALNSIHLMLQKEKYSLEETLKALDSKFESGNISEIDFFKNFKNLQKEIYIIEKNIEVLEDEMEDEEFLRKRSKEIDKERYYT